MRITCPSCQAIYDVPDALLATAPATGRPRPARLRCARCAAEWAPPELASPAPASAASPQRPAPPQPLAAPPPSPFADALVQALPEPTAPVPAAEPPPFPRPPERVVPDAYRDDGRAPPRLPPRPAGRQRTPRDSATLLFAWCVSLGLVAALLIAAYIHQADIVAAWPPAARAYSLLGLR